MTNTELLEDRIAKSGFKRSYIANRIGKTTYALALKINNKSEFKASEIDVLCELLGLNTEDRMAIFFAN